MNFSSLTRVEIAELAILAGGTLLLLAAIIRVSQTRRWKSVATLPMLPQVGIAPMDVVMVMAIFILAGSFIRALLQRAEGLPLTTRLAVGEAAPEDPALMTTVTVAGQLIVLFVVLWIVRSRVPGRLAGWGLTLRRPARALGLAILAYLLIWPICTGLLELTTRILMHFGVTDLPEHGAIQTLMDSSQPGWVRVWTIVSAVVLAPVVEEFVFRGLLFRVLAERLKSSWEAAVFSAVFFGLVHLGVPQTIPALIFFGVVLAYVYAKTGSLTLAILLHVVFNAKTILWLTLGSSV